MSDLITRSKAKKRALFFGQQRAWQPTRVSKEFLDRFSARCDILLRAMVEEHPSIGTTLK